MSTAPHSNEPICWAFTAAEVAKLLQISQRHLWLNASGRVPRPLRLGKSTLWNLAELRSWMDAGSPDRATWEGRHDLKFPVAIFEDLQLIGHAWRPHLLAAAVYSFWGSHRQDNPLTASVREAIGKR